MHTRLFFTNLQRRRHVETTTTTMTTTIAATTTAATTTPTVRGIGRPDWSDNEPYLQTIL